MTIPTWIDASGRKWTTIITVEKVRLTKEIAGVDLLKALDGDLFVEIEDDPVTLSAVLWSVCKLQAKYKNVSLQDFERNVRGESIEHGASSLIEGLLLFCPSLQQGKKDSESPAERKQPLEPASERAWKFIHELAGIVGVDPGPFSWREIDWKAKAKRRHDWNQTSLLLTINANANRDPKKRRQPFHPNDFMPEDLKEGIRRLSGFRLTPQNLHILKPFFSQSKELSSCRE